MKKKLTIFLVIYLVFFALLPMQANADIGNRKTVRAGFFAWDGYHVEDKDGIKSGYGYDLLKMTENYCNWQMEFLGYDKTWSDMLTMLDQGEIDLLTSAQKTAEWEEKYDYSDLPIGTSATILSVRQEEDQYVVGDASTYDGMMVGCLMGSSRNDKFAEFAKEKHFTYTPVYFDNLAELKQALLDKQVDAVLCTNLRTVNGETVLEEFDPVDYYVIVKKGNTEILDQLNHAISKMNLNTPSWKDELQTKYFSNPDEQELVFNKEELSYLQELKQKNRTYKVVTNPDLAPYSSFDKEGKAVGIAPDLFRELADRIGLSYEFISFQTYEEYNAYVRDGKADIDLTCFHDYGLAEDNSVNISNPYMKTSLAMLTKDTFSGNIQSIAMLDQYVHNTTYADSLIDGGVNVITYATNQECINAVLKGKADVTYQYTYAAQRAVERDVRNKLMYAILPQYEIEMCVGVNADEDYRLIAVINEGIRCLEGNYLQNLIQNEVTHISEKDSIISLIYDYPLYAFSIFAVLALVLLGIAYAMSKRKQTEILLEQESEVSTARTEFFMMISHELRTPLNAVVSYLKMMREEYAKKDADMLRYINRAQSAAQQLTEISESMLDYTRVSTGNVELKHDIFKLKDIILQADQIVSLKAKEKNLQYHFETKDIDRHYLSGDGLRVSLVFQNIMENAVKFTPEGGRVDVLIEEEAVDSDTVNLIFHCRDTGKGMSKEFVEKLDTAFHQSDPSYSRTHGGLGLGLFLTQYFVKLMNGSFEVESKEGEGSSFKIAVQMKCPSIQELTDYGIKCQPIRTIAFEEEEKEVKRAKDTLKLFGVRADVVNDPDKLLKRIKSRVGGPFEYTVCIPNMDLLKERSDVVEEILLMEHAPELFVITEDVGYFAQLRADKRFAQVIYKPDIYFELFNAYITEFGEYRPTEKKYLNADFSGIHAMVVEDNQINADILSHVLQQAKVEVTVCENGKIAVDTFEQTEENTYQIIFMDIQMPIMDGFEATRQIRNSRKEQGRKIPIIAVSANAFPEDVEKSLLAGMNAHLAKPVDENLLFHEIKRSREQE